MNFYAFVFGNTSVLFVVYFSLAIYLENSLAILGKHLRFQAPNTGKIQPRQVTIAFPTYCVHP